MYQPNSQSNSSSKPQSYLSSHPQISKRLPQTPTPKLQIPQQQYNKKRQSFYTEQQTINITLNNKLQSLQHENTMFKQSLSYFDPTQILQQLERQLQTIKSRQITISKQIQHCEIVERTTTPQQYFLFKKNKRIQTFNQAINELYEEVDKEREAMRQVMDRMSQQIIEVKAEVQKMEGELANNNGNNSNNGNNRNLFSSIRQQKRQQQYDHSSKQQYYQQQFQYNNTNNNTNKNNKNNRESICESRVNVIVQSTLSQHQHNQEQQHQQQQQQYNIYHSNNNNYTSSSSSSSQSSIQPYQLQHLKQEYKSLLQTYEIISQNNEIMTTQLFNNISSIQDSLYKYHDTQTNKLYRDLLLIKEDFSYMPLQHIIPPTQTQLNYQVTPLIHDYKNRFNQIKNKLSTDLKKITTDILAPINWENISIHQYLQTDNIQNNDDNDDDKDTQTNYLLKSSTKTNKHSQKNNKQSQRTTKNVNNIKQAQRQYQRIQQQIKRQDQIIYGLQSQLQQIMGDTMVFKQKQHQLQLAMNNMRKTLRQTQKESNPTILF